MGAELSGRRGGFTLVELLVAMLLMAAVGLSIAAVTGKLVSASARDGQLVVALDLVNERLAQAASDPSYARLEASFEEENAAVAGFPGMLRTTSIERMATELEDGGVVEFKVVEVSVMGPGLAEPVVRTTALAPR